MKSEEAIDDGTLDLLLNDLAPESRRGKKEGEGSHIDGLAGSKTTIFEHVEIERLIFSNPGPNFPQGPSAIIRFRGDGCPSER
jgi:hypothetical protein